MTTSLPPAGFVALPADPRRPLPLALTVQVTAGAFRLLVVATPADLRAVVRVPLEHPWVDGDLRTEPIAPPAGTLAAALAQPAPPLPEAIRPTLLVTGAGVLWARPLVVGAVQRVVCVGGAGHLFDLVVTRCRLRCASLVRPADVGAQLAVAVRDPRAGGPALVPPAPQEDPHDTLR